MWVQIAAGIALAVVLFSIFRYAMALRSAKVARQSWRKAEESRGRRIVAEIPGAGDGMTLFLEDDDGFYWGADEVAKRRVAGGRLRLNRGILASWARPGVVLPEPQSAEDFEGRETWDVVLYLEDGGHAGDPLRHPPGGSEPRDRVPRLPGDAGEGLTSARRAAAARVWLPPPPPGPSGSRAPPFLQPAPSAPSLACPRESP